MTSRLTSLQGLHGMRDGVLEQVDDVDLTFTPGGDNLPFGQLMAEAAALERSYLQSLQDHVQRWPASDPAAQSPQTASELRAQFTALDAGLESAVSASNGDGARITRPDGTVRSRDQQVEIYTQAMFILLGKAVVYLKAMGRDLPPSVAHYIG